MLVFRSPFAQEKSDDSDDIVSGRYRKRDPRAQSGGGCFARAQERVLARDVRKPDRLAAPPRAADQPLAHVEFPLPARRAKVVEAFRTSIPCRGATHALPVLR